MTDSPGYDWHLLNLRNYANLTPQAARPHSIDGVSLAPFGAGSGMLGLPGDFTPPSRFVRAVAFVNTMIPAKDAADAVNAASVMLNNFDIPKGLVREGAPKISSRLHAMVGDRRHEPQGLLLLDDVRPPDAFGRSFQAGLRRKGHFLFPARQGPRGGHSGPLGRLRTLAQRLPLLARIDVMPAKAGIQTFAGTLDSRFRGNDRKVDVRNLTVRRREDRPCPAPLHEHRLG